MEKYSRELNQLPVLSPELAAEQGVYPGEFWCQVDNYQKRIFVISV
jgi:hypothetical protein